ncbi:uncharacterized protein F5Z01DRAFT_441225 [Emericellopsis atlantica]|uniref:Uncharacterized protein n=1 Tax=Emericellopsis atlantica TaxID=2614577 RepID=A0A9P7ZD29_9HYPO|nr:uncharacterized protein F5Z01DRAFT_441225 [Emericellopsis atlantica]KAG9249805.1 hypothetical protein F5Z01DRAFT_441225 [Emericellopsis atlantica]
MSSNRRIGRYAVGWCGSPGVVGRGSDAGGRGRQENISLLQWLRHVTYNVVKLVLGVYEGGERVGCVNVVSLDATNRKRGCRGAVRNAGIKAVDLRVRRDNVAIRNVAVCQAAQAHARRVGLAELNGQVQAISVGAVELGEEAVDRAPLQFSDFEAVLCLLRCGLGLVVDNVVTIVTIIAVFIVRRVYLAMHVKNS